MEEKQRPERKPWAHIEGDYCVLDESAPVEIEGDVGIFDESRAVLRQDGDEVVVDDGR